MRAHTLKSLLAIAAAGLVVAGCGSDDESESSSKTETQASTAAPSFPKELLGSYTRNVTKADIERTAKFRAELGPNQETPLPGPRELVITDSKMRMISREEKPPFVLDQEIEATDDGNLTFVRYLNPQEASFCGPEIPQNATWTWKRNGDVLTLKPTKDRCADRDSELAGDWKAK